MTEDWSKQRRTDEEIRAEIRRYQEALKGEESLLHRQQILCAILSLRWVLNDPDIGLYPDDPCLYVSSVSVWDLYNDQKAKGL